MRLFLVAASFMRIDGELTGSDLTDLYDYIEDGYAITLP